MVNRLSTEQRARIIGCLTEGNSIRATVRLVADGTSVTQAARTLKISRSTAYAALGSTR